jgi:hypothetical protein
MTLRGIQLRWSLQDGIKQESNPRNTCKFHVQMHAMSSVPVLPPFVRIYIQELNFKHYRTLLGVKVPAKIIKQG